MIKLIFIDVNPYVVNHDTFLNKVWDTVINWDQFKNWFMSNPDVKDLILKKLDPFKHEEKYLKVMNEEEYKFFTQTYQYIYRLNIETFIKPNINASLKEFILTAISNEINIVLQTFDPNLISLNNIFGLDENQQQYLSVLLNSSSSDRKFEELNDYCTNLNIMCDEYIVITQNEKSLIDMQRNEVFCVTLNNDKSFKNSKNIYVIENIDDLNFGEVSYTFYSRSNQGDI